jgi:hypothetical protein
MSRIRLTIDELVLKGFEHTDGKAVAQALETELSAALADPKQRAEWALSHRTPVLRLGKLDYQPGTAGSRQLGGAIGRGIGKGLKP